MKNKIKQLEEELREQCVLNGKGAERELALLAKVERLERENAKLRNIISEHTRENAELKCEVKKLENQIEWDYWPGA